ncbi:MAG TPA: hypothetical protein VNK96_09910 [Fimbriimonadales bacterium]|nr:hypothetical protein [Fimbriimonadales bacterium]
MKRFLEIGIVFFFILCFISFQLGVPLFAFVFFIVGIALTTFYLNLKRGGHPMFGRQCLLVFVENKWREDHGRMMHSIEEDTETTRYLCKLILQDGRKIEVETNRIVWEKCPEGAMGYATLQGEWMGDFVFVPKR